VEKQKAGNAALADPKNTKNKHAESKEIAVSNKIPNVFAKNKFDKVIVRDKYEELDMKKQKADKDDTLHPHHQRQEKARREVRREKQV
jgi:hypothetical protein